MLKIIERSDIFQDGCFPLPLLEHKSIFLQLHGRELGSALESKTHESVETPKTEPS